MPAESINNYSSSLPVLPSISVNPVGSSGGNWFTKFLSNILPFGGLLDAGIGLISGISNNVYDRQLQKTIFERDDTQLTRLMNEYKRNGLNPLLGLPGASVGNTKAFEPSPIQTNFNKSFENKMAMDSNKLALERMKLDNWKAKEDLKVSRYDAEIRGYEAKQRRLNSELEAEILKGRINAQHQNKQDYFKNSHDLPYNDAGVDFSSMSTEEKAFRYLHNQVVYDPAKTMREEAFKLVEDKKLEAVEGGYDAFSYKSSSGRKYDIIIRADGQASLVNPKTGQSYGLFDSIDYAMRYADDFANF